MSQESIATSKRSTAKSIKTKPVEATAAPKKQAAKRSKAGASAAAQRNGSPEDRYNMIAVAAYYRAERRGFDGGCAMDDWLAAEAEVDAMLYH